MYELWNRLQYMLSPQFDIYEKVSNVVNGEVLDVGCGTGFGANILTRWSSHVNGIDVDGHAVKFATRCFGNGKINFSMRSIEEQVHIGKKFDWVTMIDVLEHIHYDSGAIREVKKLLKDTGTLIISTPNRLSRYRKSENHVREYSPDELRDLLSKEFKIVDMLDFQLLPLENDFTNPIIGMCSCS